MKKVSNAYIRLGKIMGITLSQLMGIILLTGMSYAADGLGQSILERNVTLEASEVKLSNVLTRIEKITAVKFIYSREFVNVHKKVSLQASNKKLAEVLNELLIPLHITYEVVGDQIVLKRQRPVLLEGNIPQISPKAFTISGKVISETGEGIPGVNVVLKGTTTGTTTNQEGDYSLVVPDASNNGILVFSYIGFTTEEIPINNRSAINITLVPDIQSLNEVVVVGYGTSRKKDLTGSIGSIDMKEKETFVNVSALQSLRGTIAGVNVVDNGRPGSDGTIQIRGRSSISANNSPLIVLDGVPYYGAISDINNNDIESIDVLKDVSSAAIYGSRSANGVILITTKKGVSEKPVINYNTYYGQSYLGNTPDYSNGPQYIQKILDGRNADGLEADPAKVADYLQPLEVENYLNGRTINPWDEIKQNAPIHNHELSFSGKGERITYYLSGSYTNQKGISRGDKFSRYTFRSNVNARITDWFSVGVHTSFSDKDYSGREANFEHASYLSPYATLYKDSEKKQLIYKPQTDGLVRNPLIDVFMNDNLDKRTSFLGNIYADLTLPKGFSYRVNYANTFQWGKDFSYNRSFTALDEGEFRLGSGYRNHSDAKNWILENIFRWQASLNDIHHFDVTFLYSREHSESYNSILSSNEVFNDALSYNGLQIGANPTISTNAGEDETVSTMIRTNYRLGEKYMLTLTARRDGFSTFGEGNKYGIFPSLAFAWNISEENFLNQVSWIEYLKLRFSYGKNGNQAIGRYASLSQIRTTNYVFGDKGKPTPGIYSTTMANPDLGWETSISYNIGLDFSLVRDKISGAVEFYNKTGRDLLLRRTLPVMNGFDWVWQNIGATNNKGLEVSLNTNNIDRNNFRWSTSFMFSTNKNKITKLLGDNNGDGKDDDIIASGWFIGKSITANYDYQWDGIYQVEDTDIPDWARPGYPRIIDKNGNGKIDTDDRTVLHDDDPDFRLGISNNLSWKNFSFSFFINSQYGGMKNNDNILLGKSFYNRANTLNVPYWTPENKNNEWPVLNYGNPWGQRFYENRSFARLQDISLAYEISPEKLKAIKIKSLRVYVSGKNLFTLTNWSNWDPEYGDTARNLGTNGPMMRTFVLGANISL